MSFLVLAKKIFGPERTDAVQIYVKRVFDEFDDDQSGELSYEGQSIWKTKIYYINFIYCKAKSNEIRNFKYTVSS